MKKSRTFAIILTSELEFNDVRKQLMCLILLLSGSGCSGASTPRVTVACPTLALQKDLNYPASGSTNIVDVQNIVIVSSDASPNVLYLQSRSGDVLSTAKKVDVPSPLPTPSLPLRPSLVETAFAIPALAAATTYTVTDTAPGTCTTGDYGTFSTK